MGIAHKIQQKLKYGLVIQYLIDRVSATGILFRPFYLVQEGGENYHAGRLSPGIKPCQSSFLSVEEIREIARHPEVTIPEKELLTRVEEGCRCFGLKHQSEILAYMWCNFSKGGSWKSFALKSNEVYLFDAWTFKVYRGKNIAPYLREQLYLHLKQMGYRTFYSVSESFNTPSIKFKRKIGAKNLKHVLYIRIFKKIHKNILLKDYTI